MKCRTGLKKVVLNLAAISCWKHFKYIMFPAIKPFYMQPQAEMRQPDILKAPPWQLCLETGAQQGGTLERVRFLWSCIITADTYHKPGRHLSLIVEKMLWRDALQSLCSSYAGLLKWRHSIWLSKLLLCKCPGWNHHLWTFLMRVNLQMSVFCHLQ